LTIRIFCSFILFKVLQHCFDLEDNILGLPFFWQAVFGIRQNLG